MFQGLHGLFATVPVWKLIFQVYCITVEHGFGWQMYGNVWFDDKRTIVFMYFWIQWNLSVTTTSKIKFTICDLFSDVF